ncbi:hypothetical protein ACOSP7_027051 [Xanthoceras sorbifolium]|uniref:F-box domain-containing protein n=1 Tax=Xanthoceras sorbifolium TaxID=99658 RepID=A0ABQ8HFF3_9ROSI|nr:hypothetical protein JRO89_XS11G0131200 [Xanthoceras sorbifolium]
MLSTKRTKTNSNIVITISTSSNHQLSSSAETIANNDDLLTEILLCQPIKSLLKFKSVSKHWLSLITSPSFSLRRTAIPKSISGLFVHRLSSQEYDFINLTSDPSHPPFQSHTFLNNKAYMLQSCNGLMLLSSNSGGHELPDNYCVYNPTTKQYTVLPPLPVNEVFKVIYGVNLAYDPSKSPHYKVICVRTYENSEEGVCQIEVYSSKTGPWRKSDGTFAAHYETEFGLGMFWNGVLHWISPWDSSLYFDADEEKVHEMPMPDTLDGDVRRRFRYFGECRGHLHLIEIYGPCAALFNVYEMERDYSGWMVKYQVDLLTVAAAFPEMVRSDPDTLDLHYYGFSILSIVREENDEDSYFLVHIPNKAIRYNFKDKSFKKIHEFAPVGMEIKVESILEYRWCHAFQYVETLAYV